MNTVPPHYIKMSGILRNGHHTESTFDRRSNACVKQKNPQNGVLPTESSSKSFAHFKDFGSRFGHVYERLDAGRLLKFASNHNDHRDVPTELYKS